MTSKDRVEQRESATRDMPTLTADRERGSTSHSCHRLKQNLVGNAGSLKQGILGKETVIANKINRISGGVVTALQHISILCIDRVS